MMDQYLVFYNQRLLIDVLPLFRLLFSIMFRSKSVVSNTQDIASALSNMSPFMQGVYGWILVMQISHLILNASTHGKSFLTAACYSLMLSPLIDPIVNVVLFMLINTLYCAYTELSMCETKVANTVWLRNEPSVVKYVYSMMTYSVYKMTCSFSWIVSMLLQLARVAFIGYCSTFEVGSPQHTFSLKSSCYPSLLLADFVMLGIKPPV
jgi:hypothetical protein